MGLVGNLFGVGYKNKIEGFKDEFNRARQAFDLSVRLDIFKAIDGMGVSSNISHGNALMHIVMQRL